MARTIIILGFRVQVIVLPAGGHVSLVVQAAVSAIIIVISMCQITGAEIPGRIPAVGNPEPGVPVTPVGIVGTIIRIVPVRNVVEVVVVPNIISHRPEIVAVGYSIAVDVPPGGAIARIVNTAVMVAGGVDYGHITIVVITGFPGIGKISFLVPCCLIEENHAFEVHETIFFTGPAVLRAVIADYP